MQSRSPIRIAVLWSPDRQAADAWLAGRDGAPDRVERCGQVTLAVWGDHAEAADGRVWGSLDGVLYNDLEVAAAWTARGLDTRATSHVGLAMAQLGALGSGGWTGLRWHGVAAALHPGLRTVLVARDPQGVGWLGAHRDGALLVLATDPAWLPEARPVPPGMAMRWMGGAAELTTALHSERLRMREDCQPFLRHLPADLATLTVQAAAERALGKWQAAAAALQRAEALGPQRQLAPLGWQAILGPAVAEPLATPERWDAIADPGPAEPLAQASADDRMRRLWRATWLADVALRDGQQAALAAGCNLAAPWLEPALLAWLEALPSGLRAAVVQRLADDASHPA